MRRRRLITAISVALWAASVVAGLGILLDYDTTPGDPGDPPQRWPQSSLLDRTPGRWTLVMAAHPKCPCTRASLAELDRIMARSGDRLQAFVLFLAPSAANEAWAESDLWERASAIPGVHAIKDADGLEAMRFRSATSGHALLYDPAGDRKYSGGITAARGHEGDNAGSRAIISALEGLPVKTETAAVFGCPLHDTDMEPHRVTAAWPK